MTKDEIRKGIAAYKHQQNVLIRLIRKTGGLTESKFDDIFRGRDLARLTSLFDMLGDLDSFILGVGLNSHSQWAENLHLLQLMMKIGLVDTKRNEHNEIVYVLP